jgi:sugar lactone lactonase YvrE
VERIAGGFSLAEAPVATAEGVLLVSDVLAGGVRRFDADGAELAPLVEGRRGIGGMVQLADGRIVVSGRDLSVVDRTGAWAVLAGLQDGGTGYNDLTVAPDGTVIAGMLTFRPFAEGEQTPGVLVGVRPDGSVETAPLPFSWPNGMGLSTDGDVFYLSDFATGVVHRSRWTGSVTDLRLEAWVTSPTGDADGLVVTDADDVWVAGGAGGNLLRYDPDGALVEQLAVPDDFVSSCCTWPPGQRLAITTGTAVFLHDLEGG